MKRSFDLLSFNQLYDLFDASYDANYIIHKLVSVDSFYFQFTLTLTALLVIPFFTPEAVAMSTGNNGDWLFELVAVRTLNLGQHSVV